MSRPRLAVFIAAAVLSAITIFAMALDAQLGIPVLPPPAMQILYTCAVLCWLTFMTLTVNDHIDKRIHELRTDITDYGSHRATEAAVTARLDTYPPADRGLHPIRS